MLRRDPISRAAVPLRATLAEAPSASQTLGAPKFSQRDGQGSCVHPLNTVALRGILGHAFLPLCTGLFGYLDLLNLGI